MIMMIKFVLLLMMMIFITCCHPGNFFDLPQTQTHCSKKSVKCIISYSIIVFPKANSTYFQSTVRWWRRDRSAQDRQDQTAEAWHRTSSSCISWHVNNAYNLWNRFKLKVAMGYFLEEEIIWIKYLWDIHQKMNLQVEEGVLQKTSRVELIFLSEGYSSFEGQGTKPFYDLVSPSWAAQS